MSEQNALNSTPRIRCTYCNRRIPASSVVCPNCQHNPRAFYWKRRHVLVIVGILVLVLIGAGFYFRQDLKQFLPASIALNPTATPSSTRPPLTVVIVVTRPPASATAILPTATRANTATPRPTDVPTVVLTATRVNTASAAAIRQPTEAPSPIPTVIPVSPPQLVAPADGELVSGSNKHIQLTYQPAQPLGTQQFFRIQVDYLDRAGNAVSWCAFTRDSVLEFPREFFDDSSPYVRSFLWHVNVVHSNQVAPTTCNAPYDTLSEPSDSWKFNWD